MEQTPQDVFTRCWVATQPTVTSYLHAAIRNTHDAEDVLQEVAAAALTSFADYDPARPFVAWALGIARLRVLNYYRHQSSDKHVFSEAVLAALASSHESLHESASQRRQALRECLKRVSPRGRRVLELRYADDLRVADVAHELAVTANAVSLLLHKVRQQLADCIERRVTQAEAGR